MKKIIWYTLGALGIETMLIASLCCVFTGKSEFGIGIFVGFAMFFTSFLISGTQA